MLRRPAMRARTSSLDALVEYALYQSDITCDVAEELLISRRRELGDPVVLPSRRRCPNESVQSNQQRDHLHGSHLRQRGNDKAKANKRPDHRPAHPSQSTILQPLRIRSYHIISHAMARGLVTHIKTNSQVACRTDAKLRAATGRRFRYLKL